MVKVIYDRRLLRDLSKRLKDADKPVKAELYKAMNRIIKPVRLDIKASALSRLPERGGLNRRVAASRIAVRRRLGSRNPRVTIAATGNPVKQARQIDRGTVRHPVYGNREAWVTQRVTPGWWTEPLNKAAPTVRREFRTAIAVFIRQIVKGR